MLDKVKNPYFDERKIKLGKKTEQFQYHSPLYEKRKIHDREEGSQFVRNIICVIGLH